MYPKLGSINECGGERSGQIDLWKPDYFLDIPTNITCAVKGNFNTYLRRIVSINYPPAGYRMIYIDEVTKNPLLKSEIDFFLTKYEVSENTALVNGYVTASFDSIKKEFEFSAYRDCGNTRQP